MATSLIAEISTQFYILFIKYFIGLVPGNEIIGGFIASIFIYIIAIGIGLISKTSLDGMLLILGLATLICSSTFIGYSFFYLFIILAGILVGISFMRLLRH
jgi:hypothetical protein